MTDKTSEKYISALSTPLGQMYAISDQTGLLALDWRQDTIAITSPENDVSRETIAQLHAYLSGTLRSFTLPISAQAMSPALRRWLEAMRQVSYGTTVSYAGLARLWGNPKAARAAGGACQKNPLPIIFPCHRIIGKDGSYERYSGGDRSTPSHPDNVARKKALLSLEAGLDVILS